MAMRCVFIALLLLSFNFLSTVAAASPASSGKISALSPVSVQGMDTTTGITQAEPRKLAGRGRGGSGGGRSGGGRRGGGGRGRSGRPRRFVPITRDGSSSVAPTSQYSAAPRSQCLGMTTLPVLATSMMVILLLL